MKEEKRYRMVAVSAARRVRAARRFPNDPGSEVMNGGIRHKVREASGCAPFLEREL